MDEHVRELIAIGASVSAHCQPCLSHHLEKARELGISDEEILAAIETGQMVSRGAMNAMGAFSASLVKPAATACRCGASSTSSSPSSCCA